MEDISSDIPLSTFSSCSWMANRFECVLSISVYGNHTHTHIVAFIVEPDEKWHTLTQAPSSAPLAIRSNTCTWSEKWWREYSGNNNNNHHHLCNIYVERERGSVCVHRFVCDDGVFNTRLKSFVCWTWMKKVLIFCGRNNIASNKHK